MAHTNYSIRKKLGEIGFLQQGQELTYPFGSMSSWQRGVQVFKLFEPTRGGQAPQLMDMDTDEPVDVDKLGVRNPNIQNDGSPDE